MSDANQAIRILILEDDEIDQRIICATIGQSELNFKVHIVETEEAFVEGLLNFRPDVVLSDFVLPDFGGLEALEIHRKTIPQTPFIFVTGQLSEETAIECLKLGAWDYIMKDHIKRLPVSIKNVLALSDERAANILKEQEILESEKRYKILSELTFEGIVIHNEGVIKDCNLSFSRMFGYEREEIIGTNAIIKLIHPDDRHMVIKKGRDGVVAPYECRGVKKDGSIFPVEQEGKNLIYDNEPVRVVAMRDITSRNIALEEIKLSEEKFTKISNAAKDAIILMDHEGKVSFWNNAASEMFQHTKAEMLGQNLHNIIAPGKYHEGHQKGYKHFLNTGEGPAVGKIIELEALRKGGETIPVELSISAINIHGKWNAVGIIRDISTRKKVESQMLDAQKHAQEMNEMKTNFLSTMSHELRTPLNGILGFSEILFESLEQEDYRDYAGIIFKSSQRILNTFNLIIDLAVLDANKVSVNRKSENLIKIIENACESYLSEATEKNLFLNQLIAVDDAMVDIDQTLLIQALNNLLNNSIKYTQQGGVTVKLSKVIKNHIPCFLVSVSDTGIGIPPEKISVIYQAFRQASEGYNRAFEGMGLGLYITKKYVDLLEGIIEMKSDVGNGTEFMIFIPQDSSMSLSNSISDSEVDENDLPSKQEAKPKILYVEDDPDHRKFVSIFLKNDFDLSCAESGPEALSLVADMQYDLILMDINLGSEMNGLEVVEKIREIPSYKEIPIAAVTANALVSQKNTYLSQGCTDYIAKPFKRRKLIDFIEKTLKER